MGTSVFLEYRLFVNSRMEISWDLTKKRQVLYFSYVTLGNKLKHQYERIGGKDLVVKILFVVVSLIWQLFYRSRLRSG